MSVELELDVDVDPRDRGRAQELERLLVEARELVEGRMREIDEQIAGVAAWIVPTSTCWHRSRRCAGGRSRWAFIPTSLDNAISSEFYRPCRKCVPPQERGE